jgi:hypothetical protein
MCRKIDGVPRKRRNWCVFGSGSRNAIKNIYKEILPQNSREKFMKRNKLLSQESSKRKHKK